MSKQTKSYKILVVDDEPDLRELLADEFEYAGHKPFLASNGKEAYDLCTNEEFDAVISDVRMPGGDGIELLEDIETDGSELSEMAQEASVVRPSNGSPQTAMASCAS